MKILEILGRDREPEVRRTYEGCRGILVKDGKILLSYYKSQDQYLIPGGGIEDGESLEECCKRELGEECGILVDPHTHYLTLQEFYHEYFFKSHYFICNQVGECETAFTEAEIRNGMEPRWVDIDEAMAIFGGYKDYEDTNEIRYGAYYREYLALCELKHKEEK